MKRCDVVVFSTQSVSNLLDITNRIFPKNLFTVYSLNSDELYKKPWLQTSKYLVLETHLQNEFDKSKMSDLISNMLKTRSHQIIAISDLLMNDLKDVDLVEKTEDDLVFYECLHTKEKCLLLLKNQEMLAEKYNLISKLLNLNTDSRKALTPSSIYLFNQKSAQQLKFRSDSLFQYDQAQYSIVDVTIDDSQNYKLILQSTNNSNEQAITFNAADYFKQLTNSSLGHFVLYGEVLESSYSLVEKLIDTGNFLSDLVVISRYQTKGRGRGSNNWISPDGCAMFTMMFEVKMNSNLGKHISLLQHVMAVSIVESFEDISGIKCQLSIKWPNDVYWLNHGKISGILSKISTFNQSFYAVLGCGINVSNEDPTVCMNQIVDICNSTVTDKLSLDSVIGSVISKMEANIQLIQQNHHDKGLDLFIRKYYSYWMHKNQRVTYKNKGEFFEGTISGIDNFGYLVLDDLSHSGDPIKLHPDGNSFDMMHNLITSK